MKIHYVGYSTCFDEWTPFRADRGSGYFPFVRSEKLFIPSENSLEDRKESFHGQLAREIKKKLWSGRREDPDINIDLNVDQDVFMEGLGSVLPGVLQRGKMVYQLESNRVLDSYLGLKWDERILNVAGDFAYVIPGTIKYWLGQRSPIIEYKLIVVGVLNPFITCCLQELNPVFLQKQLFEGINPFVICGSEEIFRSSIIVFFQALLCVICYVLIK